MLPDEVSKLRLVVWFAFSLEKNLEIHSDFKRFIRHSLISTIIESSKNKVPKTYFLSSLKLWTVKEDVLHALHVKVGSTWVLILWVLQVMNSEESGLVQTWDKYLCSLAVGEQDCIMEILCWISRLGQWTV